MIEHAIFERVYEIIKSENIRALEIQAEQTAKMLKEDKTIDVAVLGEFKVGKSSFINCFIGEEVLPVGVIPVTSVITRIAKGDRKEAFVRYLNGKTESVEAGKIDEFVNESKNPENVRQVEYVDVRLPQIDFLGGLQIVDTPGLRSFWKHNTETTKQWFGRVGVAIVAISAERPLSNDEILLIKEIEKETPEIVILLTKTDLFTRDEIEKIELYIRSSLRTVLGKDFRIFKYSTRKNTDKFQKEMVKFLIEPLVSRFELKRKNIINRKINLLAVNCIDYLEIALASSRHSEDERKKLKKVIFDKKINQNFVAQEMALVLTDELNGIRDEIQNVFMPERENLKMELIRKFRRDYKKWNGNLYKRTRRFENWMKEELSDEFKMMIDENRDYFENIVKEAGEHFGFFANSFRNSLKDRIEKVLGVKMTVEKPDIHLEGIKNPDLRVSWTFESHIDLLWFLFPMPVFGRMFGKYFEKQIPREIEINIYRIASAITANISKSIRNIKEQSQGYITEELRTIENLLNGTISKSLYYEELIEELRKL